MEKLSVVIITKNEEKNIENCLASVSWADEIVVLDSGSTDRTLAICRKFDCKTATTEWLGFGKTKQKAVEMASHRWILSIDADETVSPELRIAIEQILQRDRSQRMNAYKIRRKSWYLNRWINHCGWNRDYPLRLFNRDYAQFNDKLIHEGVVAKGSVGSIDCFLFHYTYPNIDSHLEKLLRYGHYTAESKLEKGKKASVTAAFLRGTMKFIRMYLLQAGFLDGTTGFVLSVNSAFGVYLKYLFLWEHTTGRGKEC